MINRYFVINKSSPVMHIYGLCQQTKPRSVAIRLFESEMELSEYAQRKLRLCEACQKALNKMESK